MRGTRRDDTYGHDAAGNLTRIDHGTTGLSYDYDPWSRMTKATELASAPRAR